ncbi:MAG: sugar transporter ATP-binding protein [Aeromicrobium sp.]|nr:sugar transporter ATP-binding protein [Aeromicrobium sp.]
MMSVDTDRTVLQVTGLGKAYGGARALDDVSFDLRAGEIHALLGENGAGKSTLIKSISGSVRPDTGTIAIAGHVETALTPAVATRLGVGTVFQELSLVPQLTIAQNIFLGQEPTRGSLLDKRAMQAGAVAALARIGVDLDPRRRVTGLSRAQMQLVEIARVLHRDSRVLILDEPTASLSSGEADRLFETLGQLRAQGIGIIYISHRLAEVKQLADRITVLRDGRFIATLDRAEVTDDQLVRLMAGRSLDQMFATVSRTPGETRLRIDGLCGPSLQDVAIQARAGEIVGIAGLVGSGKSEIGRACFGLEPMSAGTIEVDGTPLRRVSPASAMRRGLIYYPSDRHAEGLVRTASLGENITLAPVATGMMSRLGLVSHRSGAARQRDAIDRLGIKGRADRSIMELSGGNQQKALLARSFARDFAVHIFDEPTVGIDVGAKADVYAHMRTLCEAGAAVVMISSDTEEVLGMCHRIYVVREGRLVAELTGDERTEDRVVSAFFHSTDSESDPT